MARNYTLIEQAEAHGKTPVQVIVEALEQTGSIHAAAKKLKVNRNTLLYHLDRAGLRVETTMTPSVKIVSAHN